VDPEDSEAGAGYASPAPLAEAAVGPGEVGEPALRPLPGARAAREGIGVERVGTGRAGFERPGSGDRGVPQERGFGRAGAWLAGIATIAALGLARELLVPFAFAGLLAYLLAPAAHQLERLRFRRGLAAAVCVLVLAGAGVGLAAVFAGQVVEVSASLPRYRENLQSKLEGLEDTALSNALRALEDLGSMGATRAPAPGEIPTQRTPLDVRVVEDRRPSYLLAVDLFGPFFPALGVALVVLVITVFLLAFRLELRERFIRVVSRGELVLTSSALDDVNRHISRFLVTQLVLNAAFAVPITLGLVALDVPNAVVWGVLAGLLRFVPVVGVWIAACAPLAMAAAAHPTWGPMLGVLGLFVVVELLFAQWVEPVFVGHRTGLSPIAVVLCTIFWTWLWGAPGLLLAVPMTLCLAVAGRYVRPLRFVHLLVGVEPSLSVPHRVYERLLADDPDGAREVVRRHVEAAPESSPVDDVLVPALARVAADRRREVLSPERALEISESARLLGDALEDGEGPVPPPRAGAGRVLLVPVADPGEAVLCELLAGRLARVGVPSSSVDVTTTSGELVMRVTAEEPEVIVLTGLPPRGALRVRYLAKRLRALVPAERLVAVLWEAPEVGSAGEAGLEGLVGDVVRRFPEAVERIRLRAEAAALPERARART
jgi:predicted PurR-regulated permease PerM